MTSAQTEFTESELLEDHSRSEPLIIGDLVCHGGFDGEGNYFSPRTKNRWPAIAAWEERRRGQFGTDRLALPTDSWPESFPNTAQQRLLIANGVTDPVVTALTRIGTFESFGSLLRVLPAPDYRRCFAEDISGTAIAHISHGLFEAHARDEAGWDGVAGHDQMWYAARDLAFEKPVANDLTEQFRQWAGVSATETKPAMPLKSLPLAERMLPADIDADLELVVARMIALYLIEVSAFHTFAWAEEILSDGELVGGGGESGRIVSYIRQDETPHVAWLRTALSEMRDRTWVGSSGRLYEGTAMMEQLWTQALGESVLLKRQENLNFFMNVVVTSLAGRVGGDDLLDEVLSLGQVKLQRDGTALDTGSPCRVEMDDELVIVHV